MNRLIAQELHSIAMAGGGVLTPEAVVTAAQDAASPLHAHFTWDDAEAAAAHRLNQARALIRSVRLDIRVDHVRIQSVYYVHDPDGDEQGYIAVNRVRSDREKAEAVLDAELARAASAAERARLIALSIGLGDEVEQRLRVSLGLNGPTSAVA